MLIDVTGTFTGFIFGMPNSCEFLLNIGDSSSFELKSSSSNPYFPILYPLKLKRLFSQAYSNCSGLFLSFSGAYSNTLTFPAFPRTHSWPLDWSATLNWWLATFPPSLRLQKDFSSWSLRMKLKQSLFYFLSTMKRIRGFYSDGYLLETGLWSLRLISMSKLPSFRAIGILNGFSNFIAKKLSAKSYSNIWILKQLYWVSTMAPVLVKLESGCLGGLCLFELGFFGLRVILSFGFKLATHILLCLLEATKQLGLSPSLK